MFKQDDIGKCEIVGENSYVLFLFALLFISLVLGKAVIVGILASGGSRSRIDQGQNYGLRLEDHGRIS